MASTTIVDIDVALDVKKDVAFKKNIVIPSLDVFKKIRDSDNDDLLRVVKTMDSPITIVSVDVVDDDYILKNLKKKEE